ncbi:MAG: hypothetical protein RMM51_06615 [Verrucomicrobiae bacterium]|nr:hypothetical protein [Verrucomicrobiae bacterium]
MRRSEPAAKSGELFEHRRAFGVFGHMTGEVFVRADFEDKRARVVEIGHQELGQIARVIADGETAQLRWLFSAEEFLGCDAGVARGEVAGELNNPADEFELFGFVEAANLAAMDINRVLILFKEQIMLGNGRFEFERGLFAFLLREPRLKEHNVFQHIGDEVVEDACVNFRGLEAVNDLAQRLGFQFRASRFVPDFECALVQRDFDVDSLSHGNGDRIGLPVGVILGDVCGEGFLSVVHNFLCRYDLLMVIWWTIMLVHNPPVLVAAGRRLGGATCAATALRLANQ